MIRPLVTATLCALALVALFASVADSAVPDPGLDVLRGGAADAGFVRALEPREFQFPRDHGPHPEFRHEWWYVTGNLQSPAGERFGFELTFFRVALQPPTVTSSVAASGVAVDEPRDQSAWRTRQVYVAHFAITDVSRARFRSAQRYSRDALGLAGAAAAPFHVWLDDWTLGGNPNWTLHAQQKGYDLTLDVKSLAAPILNGDHGLSIKSSEPGAASYYYSIPRVEVQGKLVRDGIAVPVSGTAWLDREWGSGSLGGSEVGWDWFALQLDDGSALMFYALRNQDGSREAHSAGTWVDPSGVAHALSSDQVQIDVGSKWESPRGGTYPARWRVRVPSVGLDVDVKPVLADQELSTFPRYWEGAVDVVGSGSGAKTRGRGYVELVGYSKAGGTERH